MNREPPHYGAFSNGVPHLRFGTGSKTLLFLLGGPGNLLPKGAAAAGFLRGIRPLASDYIIYLASRKSGLTEGYTTRDMADDYAEVIRSDFGGRVDLIIGFSFGGMIAQHFAVDHAGLCGHLVIGGAAHRVADAALAIDLRYAVLINQGRDREAMAARAEAVVRGGPLRYLLAGVLWLAGKRLLGPLNETFRHDVLIEALAERTHRVAERLGRITVPVLVVCGASDFAFPLADVEAMARMIPTATLRVYQRGHSAIVLDPRFPNDVRRFVAAEPLLTASPDPEAVEKQVEEPVAKDRVRGAVAHQDSKEDRAV